MSKVKANNYTQASKELSAVKGIPKELVNSLPSEIAESDRGHYVVALVKKTHNPQEEAYDYAVHIQQFDEQSFKQLQKRGVNLFGYSQAIVLHEPEAGEKPAQNVAAQAPAETAEQMEARIRKELEAKYGPATSDDKDVNVGKNTNPIKLNVNDPKTQDISAYDLDHLKAFAKNFEIDITGKTKKADIFQAIKEWQSGAAGKDATIANLAEMNVEELKAFAKENEVVLPETDDKEEILSILLSWQDAQDEEK